MKENGTSIPWVETEAGRHITHRLNHPSTLASIDHLLNRLDTLEQAVERLASLLEQGPGLLSMAADTADETVANAQRNGIDLSQRLDNTMHLLERLTAKETVAKVDQLIELTDQLPGLVAMGMDVADEGVKGLNASGIDLNALTQVATASGQALSEARKEVAPRLSIIGLWRAMRDKDRQKGLGFLMNFLKHLGKRL